MKRRHFFLSVLLALLPLATWSQKDSLHHAVPVRQGNLPATFKALWRYHPGDDPAWAAPGYSDSAWETTYSEFYTSGGGAPRLAFPGVGWFRMWIFLDSALVRRPLGLSLNHKAQAAVYIDGQRIPAAANPKDELRGSVYKPPLVTTIDRPGRHLIAVRYEDSAKRSAARSNEEAGFRLSIDTAPAAIEVFREQLIILTSMIVLFIVFFFSFGLLHLILFLYYRAERSNAWFSLFCMSAGVFFLLFYAVLTLGSRSIEAILEGKLGLILAPVFLALSALINQLFGRGRLRFRIAQAGLAALLAAALYRPLTSWVAPMIVSLVCIEALVLILRSIARKEPGARIIGSGILVFALIIIALAFVFTVDGVLDRSVENEVTGAILGIVFILAIVSVPLSMSAYLSWNYARIQKGLRRQLYKVERLSAERLRHEAEKQRLLETRAEDLEREVGIRTEELRRQRDKSDELLENILPAEVAEELKENGSSAARLYDNVSVLFTDFADFTQRSEALSPGQLVHELNHCFSAFDGIITRHGLEKIKTVGDAYIAVSGLPAANERHAQAVVAAALEIRDFMVARKAALPATFGVRLGVHSGPVVAGIVGVKKFAYDIWGDTVNTAARMEQHSEDGRLNISAATYELVKDDFHCTFRGELEAKHKGKMGMYYVNSPMGEFAN